PVHALDPRRRALPGPGLRAQPPARTRAKHHPLLRGGLLVRPPLVPLGLMGRVRLQSLERSPGDAREYADPLLPACEHHAGGRRVAGVPLAPSRDPLTRRRPSTAAGAGGTWARADDTRGTRRRSASGAEVPRRAGCRRG